MLGVTLVPTGLVMLIAPSFWYARFPGVASTGPLNAHLARDFGCAILLAGTAFLWSGLRPARGLPCVVAGGSLLVLHALVHLGEMLIGRHTTSTDFTAALAIYSPAALAIYCRLAWRSAPGAAMHPGFLEGPSA